MSFAFLPLSTLFSWNDLLIPHFLLWYPNSVLILLAPDYVSLTPLLCSTDNLGKCQASLLTWSCDDHLNIHQILPLKFFRQLFDISHKLLFTAYQWNLCYWLIFLEMVAPFPISSEQQRKMRLELVNLHI